MHLSETSPEANPDDNPDAISEATESVLLLHGGNVAGWMWDQQQRTLTSHHVLVPDLPGFGASAGQEWTSVADVADQLAELVRERGHGGRAHVVGLSLGGILGIVLTARHPRLVHSTLVSGATLGGVRGMTRRVGLLQLRFWDQRWYWAAQAKAFRLPADSVEIFVRTGLESSRAAATAMMREVYDGIAGPDLDGLRSVTTPILALAGEREPRLVRDSFPELTRRVPQARTAIVPGMHHAWNAEDPELFNDVMLAWLRDHRLDSRLLPPT